MLRKFLLYYILVGERAYLTNGFVLVRRLCVFDKRTLAANSQVACKAEEAQRLGTMLQTFAGTFVSRSST